MYIEIEYGQLILDNSNIQFLAHVDRGSHDQTAHPDSHIVHFSHQCWLTESKKSELHGVNLQSDLRIDMSVRNYRVALPVSVTARTYVSTFTKVCSWSGK